MLHAVARRAAIRAVLAAALLTALVACSPSSADRGNAAANTVRTEPSANPTIATAPLATTTTNPYAVPAAIDVAYVNRVLAGLDAANGDTTRLVIRTRTITQEAYDRLKAIYADPTFMQINIDGYERDIRDNFRSYKSSPGDLKSTVSRLISARSDCVFVQVSRDYTSAGINPLAELQTQWVALTLLDRTRDPKGYNPTPWAFKYDGFPPNRNQPADPCAS